MKRSITLILSVLFLLSTFLVVHEARGVDKEKCQAAMNDYIQEKLAAGGGKYDIEGAKADFDSVHEQVREKGELFESCAFFKAGENKYDIDYHVKEQDGKYMVVKEILHKVNGEKVDRVLWEKK